MDLFNATIGFESYAPHLKAPTLWLGATNDFHGIMDDTYRTGEKGKVDEAIETLKGFAAVGKPVVIEET